MVDSVLADSVLVMVDSVGSQRARTCINVIIFCVVMVLKVGVQAPHWVPLLHLLCMLQHYTCMHFIML